MPCKLVQSDFLDFANRETTPLRSWAIRRHVAACPDCATELAAVQQFQTALRGADLLPPETIAVPLRPRSPRRRVYAAAFAAVLIGSLFLFPVLHQGRSTVQNPGAAIAAALGRVNTWHFAGWKQIDGKQIPWEIWGRRAPWLYYERVGDTVTWSDGKTCLRVYPPNSSLKRPQGLLVKNFNSMSWVETGFLGDPAYQSLVSDSRSLFSFEKDGGKTLFAQTTTLAKYRVQYYQGMSGINENKLYTISKRDWLPTTYQLHFENPKLARDTEYLTVHYGDNLPDEVVVAPSLPGYSVVDFTHPGPTFQAGGTTNEERGFRVQATPLAQDKEGNLLISVRGWLGGNPLTPEGTFILNVSPFNEPNNLVGVGGGKSIKYLYASNSSVPPGAEILLPYQPLEPSEVASAPPKTFLLTLSASPQVLVRGSDQLFSDGRIQPQTYSQSLTTDSFRFTLAAPQTPVTSLAAALPLGTPQEFRLPTQRDYFEQRRVYYYSSPAYRYSVFEKYLPKLVKSGAIGPDGTLNPGQAHPMLQLLILEAVDKQHKAEFKSAEQAFRRRAVYWQQKIVALPYNDGTTHWERENRFGHHADDLRLLAYCYRTAGDKANQDKTLQELIEFCPKLSDHGGLLLRQMEYTLRTGQFPDDPNYKGPA